MDLVAPHWQRSGLVAYDSDVELRVICSNPKLMIKPSEPVLRTPFGPDGGEENDTTLG